MQSRFPNPNWENGLTSSPYSVFEGFTELFEDFEPWLSRATGARVHGHLFHPDKVQFDGDQSTFGGALSDSAVLRDYNAQMFLRNLIWNTRGERQCFQFGPGDRQFVSWEIAKDPNAQISVVTGAWAIPLFQSNRNFSDLRVEAAWLQKVETDHLKALRSIYVKARIRIWTLAEFVEAPMEGLQTVVDEITGKTVRRLTEAPRMVDLTGFGQFLQNLKNHGMHPYLMGDFPTGPVPETIQPSPRKPYLVR